MCSYIGLTDAADLLNVRPSYVLDLVLKDEVDHVIIDHSTYISIKEIFNIKRRLLEEAEEARTKLARLGQELESKKEGNE